MYTGILLNYNSRFNSGFFIKQKTAYEMRISDWSSDVCSSDLQRQPFGMVPAFEADGQRLFESGAIVHRIAQDSAALMPADAQARAEVLTWMFAALNTVEPPIQNLLEMDMLHAGETWVPLRRHAGVEVGRASGRERGCQY